jgi:hypothetical protein
MINQSFLYDRFDYVDGQLFYKKSIGAMKKGLPVGTPDKDGYLKTLINKRSHRLHRLIYMMHHGFVPLIVDHIDNNKLNNKIENLRAVNWSESNLNRGKHQRNTSGYKGVTFVKTENKFSSRIAINGKRYFLGYFDTAKEAHNAYCRAAKNLTASYVRT